MYWHEWLKDNFALWFPIFYVVVIAAVVGWIEWTTDYDDDDGDSIG